MHTWHLSGCWTEWEPMILATSDRHAASRESVKIRFPQNFVELYRAKALGSSAMLRDI